MILACTIPPGVRPVGHGPQKISGINWGFPNTISSVCLWTENLIHVGQLG